MLEYYENDENYISTEGCITGLRYYESDDRLDVDLNLKSDFSKFPGNTYDYGGRSSFMIINYSQLSFRFYIGDTIKITSAPSIFYDGQDCPIVQLEKDGVEYLSFEEGKAAYLDWIKTTFAGI